MTATAQRLRRLGRRLGRATGALRVRRLETRVDHLEVGFAEEALFRDRLDERLEQRLRELARVWPSP
jgi:hypothetical protein